MQNQLFYSLMLILLLGGWSACTPAAPAEQPETEDTPAVTTVGSIEIFDEAAYQVIPRDAKIEVLAEGFKWTEGPVWIEEGAYLLFSDIPNNTVFKWKEGEGISEFLKPSGFSGKNPPMNEPGSNGLALTPDGKLLLCQHGDRQIGVMNAPLSNPKPEYTSVVNNYQGKRFNSPNDCTIHSNGNLYFTDPPYGLTKGMEDPEKELDFQGVYLFTKDQQLKLLTDTVTRPNGIALSPDESTLYVAVSDPELAIWIAYDVQEDGTITNGRNLYNATELVGKEEEKGLPDGMKVNDKGILFATGPGGVWIFQPDGTPLAKIRTGQATANCAFGPDQKRLYMTADDYLMAVDLL